MLLLLIEDDDDLRGEIHDYLARRRHEVTALGSATEARRILDPLRAGQPFDAVICDMNLTDGDGIDLYVEFGSRRPACRWILMSGDPDTGRVADERRKHPTLPPCIVIEKPMSLRKLTDLLTGDGTLAI